MSGVAGAERVRSRKDYLIFVKEYNDFLKGLIKDDYTPVELTGSFESDLTKQDFGDIDLLFLSTNTNDKPTYKKFLVDLFTNQPDDIIVPFSSPKYTGRKTYNSGEIVTIRFHSKTLGYSVQIDNIICLSEPERIFKKQFLDIPAEKQGLLLGLAKVVIQEFGEDHFNKILHTNFVSYPSSKLEFSLSSSGLELRLYYNKDNPSAYIDIWKSLNFHHVKTLLMDPYNFDQPFPELLYTIRDSLTHPTSMKRIVGLFKSMVTVKSGEVGTPKGNKKEQALTLVSLCLTP